MKLLFKDSGLDRLKASVQFCAECRKPQVHYVAAGGWPICHACGYNRELVQFCEQEPAYWPSRGMRSAAH